MSSDYCSCILHQQDGLYCVQIGQSRLGQCDARFTFPGSKCGASESPEDCLARRRGARLMTSDMT
eukprot:2478493-Amphidinium_carterae.1